MKMNYFSIERDDRCIESVLFNNDKGEFIFQEVLSMTYDEIKSYEHIEEFVVCVMDVTNRFFDDNDDQTLLTLIGEDGVFIWSILIGPDKGDAIRYTFLDWQKDGKNYRYKKD
jgi:hypothetical protein